jgi:hypothetical protein
MSLPAWLIIAALVTALLARMHRAVPALLAGLVTFCLLLATFPSIGPALTTNTGEVARGAGAAVDRAAEVPPDGEIR